MTLAEAAQSIGRPVVYRGRAGELERGVITSVNDEYVFVRYGQGTTSAATSPEDVELEAGWYPPGWQSLAGGGTPADLRATRVCECERCRADGQHEPMCAVHEEPPQPCNCPKA